MSDSATQLISHYGYIGLFVLLVLGIVGLPLPDETLMAGAGYMVLHGEMRLLPAFLAAVTGSCCGITLSFALGRTVGYPLVSRYGYLLHLSEQKFERVRRWYEKKGRWVLTFGYFVPGVRHAIAIVAGTSRLRLRTFAVFAYSGAALWATTFLSAGYFLGDQWQRGSTLVRAIIVLVLGSGFIVVLAYGLIRHWRGGSSSDGGER
jgi:membrane protein DedA with SNARE-associated domain